MSEPLFSILIANYNNGSSLMRAVESVRTQEYAHWEIIIVDDASTDDSSSVYTQLQQDNRIHIYHNEHNMGCGYTKARCAELATGDISGFLDPDDRLLPGALQAMVDVHTAHPEVSIVYSRCHAVSPDGKWLGDNQLMELKEEETYFVHRAIGAMNFCSYKSASYRKTEGINKNIRAGVDQDLYFKVEEVGKPFVLNQFTYEYVCAQKDAITSKRNKAALYYWNLEVRRAACLRRGLNVDDYLLPDFKNMIDATYRMAYDDGAAMVHNSISYRVGKIILAPIYWIKQLFKK